MSVRSNRTRGWLWVHNEVMDRFGEQLGPYGLAAYFALARLTDNDSQGCTPAVKTLCKKTGMSERKMREELHILADMKLIEINERYTDEGDRSTNEYVLLPIPDDMQEEQDPRQHLSDRSRATAPTVPRTMQVSKKDSSSKDPIKQDSSYIHESDFSTYKWGSPEALVHMYNEESPDELPAVQVLSKGRRDRTRELLRMFPQQGFWTECMKQLRASKMMRGLKHSPGHEHWRADFDWLLGKKNGVENCVRLHDGRFHD